MKHQYHDSMIRPGQCTLCNKDEISHGPDAECDICGRAGDCEVGDKNLIYCFNCRADAYKAKLDSAVQSRSSNFLSESRQIDSSIRIRTDIFNAKTVAIHALKESIDTDPSIENKHFKLAEVINERFTHLKDVIFSKRAEISELESEQSAINTYYNELSKRLKSEERALIKIKDASYTPVEPKTITVKKAPKVDKFDKVALANASKESGIPEQVIRILCITKNCAPLEAVRIFQASLAKNNPSIELESK